LILLGPRKPKVKRSKDWPKLRNQWLQVHPRCAVCGEQKHLEVHHLIPVHFDPSKELDVTNLITLCEQKSHNDHLLVGHLLDWKSMNPDCVDNAKLLQHEILMRPYLK